MDINRIKIILVGSFAVGKSSVINSLMKKEFNTNIVATIGLQFQTCKIKYLENEYILSIFDTAGQERYRSLVSMYFQKVNIVLLVIDVTGNINEQLSEWLDYITMHKNKFIPGYHIIIIFNKVDLVENFQVNYDMSATHHNTIKIYLEESNYTTVVTSCKEDIGFDTLRSIITTYLNKIENVIPNNTIILTDSSNKTDRRSYCCYS